MNGRADAREGDAPLKLGPLNAQTVHLCVDMQNMFAEETEWHTPWMRRVLPVVERIARQRPDRTVFTRFIPVARPEEAHGAWRRYYERWRSMTTERLDPRMIELVASLAELVPPATVIDKRIYSPWLKTELDAKLRQGGIDSLIISGAETDVCVLATVLGAVDLGYRVILPMDALCSSSDQTHDALITLYRNRYGQQVETASSEEILDCWQ